MEVRRLRNGSRDELMHHGVKGQKWGVRRYQNYDGSPINPTNSTTNKDPRKKRTSTGNSKGVYRRNSDGPGLNGTTFYTRAYENGRKEHYAVSKNNKLQSNQIGCRKTYNAKGEEVYSLQFKDSDSLKTFYNTKAGQHLLSDPTAIQTLAKAANSKGYLEYDVNYMSSANAESMPFTGFTNITAEEQMNPGLIGLNDEKDEEYEPEDMSTHTNGTGVTIDMSASMAAAEAYNNQLIQSAKVEKAINTGIQVVSTIISGLRMTPVTSSKKIFSTLLNKISNKK